MLNDAPFLEGRSTSKFQISNALWYYEHGKTYKTNIYHAGKGHYINLDCGLASASSDTITRRLGILRLDDMKEFYIE